VIQIEAVVLKMKIGKTEKDEREETSGLTTKLDFEVVGSPRALARMANVLKQGNTNIKLILEVTNAATDVDVTTRELPHQMGLGESAPAVEFSQPGITPVRTGEPIVQDGVKATEDEIARNKQREESDKQFDAIESANPNTVKVSGETSEKPGVVIVDLSQFAIKVPAEGEDKYTVSLNGTRKKGTDLIRSILTVFNSKAVACKTAKDLSDTLLLYPQSQNRDMLLEILQFGKMPEGVK